MSGLWCSDPLRALAMFCFLLARHFGYCHNPCFKAVKPWFWGQGYWDLKGNWLRRWATSWSWCRKRESESEFGVIWGQPEQHLLAFQRWIIHCVVASDTSLWALGVGGVSIYFPLPCCHLLLYFSLWGLQRLCCILCLLCNTIIVHSLHAELNRRDSSLSPRSFPFWYQGNR